MRENEVGQRPKSRPLANERLLPDLHTERAARLNSSKSFSEPPTPPAAYDVENPWNDAGNYMTPNEGRSVGWCLLVGLAVIVGGVAWMTWEIFKAKGMR